MPYSRSHRYVFVAIPKTGTTSVVNVLKAAHARHGGELLLLKEPIDATFRERHRLDEIGDPQPARAKHLSALQLKYVLGAEYGQSFSFSVVRNPWSRVVSNYLFTHVDHQPPPEEKVRREVTRSFHDLGFEPWLERRWQRGRERWGRTQLSKLVDLDGRLIVDFVGRLESLQEALDHIGERVGLPGIRGAWLNRSASRYSYADYFDDRTRDMVREMFAEDIEAFGYRFGD